MRSDSGEYRLRPLDEFTVTRKRMPVKHSVCRKVVMWYVGAYDPVPGAMIRAADFEYLDGTRPADQARLPMCPHCGAHLKDVWISKGPNGNKELLTK